MEMYERNGWKTVSAMFVSNEKVERFMKRIMKGLEHRRARGVISKAVIMDIVATRFNLRVYTDFSSVLGIDWSSITPLKY